MSNKALIFGITGQDGSYLAELLLSKNYIVHGCYRRTSTGNLRNIEHIKNDLLLHRGDITDYSSVVRVLKTAKPDEIYNLADQDNVDWSFALPSYAVDVTYGGVANVLEAVRTTCARAKVFQPVTALMFGDSPPPQDESTKLNPNSPYACAKTGAYYLARHYAMAYDMFVACGIMYNHDSPRRSQEYLLHRICHQAVAVARGKLSKIPLGDPDYRVDIGHAADYVLAMWMILQGSLPKTYVVGTGISHKIKYMVAMALAAAGVIDHTDIVGVEAYLTNDPWFKRPGNPPILRANTNLIQNRLGWQPKITLQDLINQLVDKAKSS